MKRAREGESGLTNLYRATAFFIVIVMIRPQDIYPVLGLVKPGLIATLLLVIAVLHYGKYPHLRDSIVRSYFYYIVILASTLIVVVNHYHWFWNLFSVVTYVLAFVIAMPVLLQSEKYRGKLVRLIFVCFAFAAIFAIAHKGVGPGDWLGDENDMACALSLGAAFSAAFGISAPRRSVRWLGWGLATLCAVGIVIAGSRGGFLGFLGVVLGLLYFSGRLWRGLIVAAVIACAAYPLIPQEAKSDFVSIGDSKDATRRERIYSWTIGVEMFADSPLLGVGLGNYPWRIGEFQEGDLESGRYWRSLAGRVAHSSYVTVLAESGILGSIPYLLVIALILLRSRSVVHTERAPEDWRRTFAIAAGSGMCGAGVAAAFITFSYAPPLFFLAGLAVATYKPTEAEQAKASPARRLQQAPQ